MENRNYNNNRKRRILPSFITKTAWKPGVKRRRLSYNCRRLYRIAANSKVSVPDIKEPLPNDLLKLIFKFNHAQNFTTDLEFIKYKFLINEDLRILQNRLEQFINKYNPLPYQIHSLIIMIAKRHRSYRYNMNDYPIFLYDLTGLIRSYIGSCRMTNQIRESCSCHRRCKSCIQKELRIAYLLHILDHNRNLKFLLTSRSVQRELSMKYLDLRKNRISDHWIIRLYNDVMFNLESTCHISKWNNWSRK